MAAEVRVFGVQTGAPYRLYWLYRELVTQVAQRHIVCLPYAKLYRFLERCTAQLQATDPAAHDPR